MRTFEKRNDAKAHKAFKKMHRMTHDKRVVYMRGLPHEIQWRVARLAAGGKL